MAVHEFSPEYLAYLETARWREQRAAALERAGERCQICNQGDEAYRLVAHHRIYERLGHEDAMDLTVLCTECHDLFHRFRRVQGAPTAEAVTGYHGDILSDRHRDGKPSYEEIIERRRRALDLGLDVDADPSAIKDAENASSGMV